MAKQAKNEKKVVQKAKVRQSANDSGGMIYVTGFVGALIYFIQDADTFWTGVLGVLKAIVWPGYIVYKLLESFYG